MKEFTPRQFAHHVRRGLAIMIVAPVAPILILGEILRAIAYAITRRA